MDANGAPAYDVVVVGGGAAGLSGAIALARSRRRVVVVDDGDPRNARAAGVHNFLTREGTPPAEILALGRAELRGYGGVVRAGRVTAVRRHGDELVVETSDGAMTGRRVLVATGVRDALPDVPGLAERWGVDVLHCPYCHGWEVRDQRVGVLATNAAAAHQALLFRQLTPHVTFLRHTGPELAAEQLEQLLALGVEVVSGEVTQVLSRDDRLTGVRLHHGSVVALDALVVAPVVASRAEMLAPLGLHPEQVRFGDTLVGDQVSADPLGMRAAPGVYVAGNVTSAHAQVMSSAAAGTMTAAAINGDLITEDARRAVTSASRRRDSASRSG